jgi:LCP family protein required for cell wall assembly
MSELRPRSNRSTSTQGIARHGQLKKSNPWPTIVKIVAAALAVVLVSGASVGAVAFNSIYSQREVVTLVSETQGPPPQIGAIEGGFNILIVGTDTRVGQGGIGGDEEEVSSVLNDVNMLLHVSEDQTNATAVSFPRDMVVGIPECAWEDGSGTKGYSTEPLNVALYYGGLPCVVQTIELLTGLPIQFAGMIGFQGVISMSDAIGGVDVCVDAPVLDEDAGLNLPTAGTHTLQGFSALAFLRSRKGVGDGSDLSRISSQQVFLSSLVRKLKSSETLGDVKKVYDLSDAAFSNMVLSSSLADVSTMASIALALKDIPLERVTFVQYPGRTGGSGIYTGKVQPNEDLGDALMEQIASDQPFVLEAAGDDRGSQLDPNAPAPAIPDPAATDAPVTAPIDNTGLPVLEGISGQTAADYTCSIAN